MRRTRGTRVSLGSGFQAAPFGDVSLRSFVSFFFKIRGKERRGGVRREPPLPPRDGSGRPGSREGPGKVANLRQMGPGSPCHRPRFAERSSSAVWSAFQSLARIGTRSEVLFPIGSVPPGARRIPANRETRSTAMSPAVPPPVIASQVA